MINVIIFACPVRWPQILVRMQSNMKLLTSRTGLLEAHCFLCSTQVSGVTFFDSCVREMKNVSFHCTKNPEVVISSLISRE